MYSYSKNGLAKIGEPKMNFDQWINQFLEEKNILHHNLKVEGELGINIIPTKVLVEFLKSAAVEEKRKIQEKMVQIDYFDGDLQDFLNKLAVSIVD